MAKKMQIYEILLSLFYYYLYFFIIILLLSTNIVQLFYECDNTIFPQTFKNLDYISCNHSSQWMLLLYSKTFGNL